VIQVYSVICEKRVACPFLLDAQCAIYTVRPLICRIHIQKNAPEQCAIEPQRLPPKISSEIAGQAVTVFNPTIYTVTMKPLVYAIAKEFNVKIKSKPIMVMQFSNKQNRSY